MRRKGDILRSRSCVGLPCVMYPHSNKGVVMPVLCGVDHALLEATLASRELIH